MSTMNIDTRRFFKLIVNPSEQLRRLALPDAFVRVFGRSLLRHAYLRNPDGVEHKVDVLRQGSDVWFSGGWEGFVKYHSLGLAHMLVFDYEGNSRFSVLVFDGSCSEIEYGGRSDKALARANAFESKNPHFVAYMRHSYVANECRMWVPAAYAKKYMQGEKDNVLRLLLGAMASKGRTWKVNYTSEVPTQGRLNTVRLTAGWKDFVVENSLRFRDVCVFELIDEPSKTYKVRIFRSDEGTSS